MRRDQREDMSKGTKMMDGLVFFPFIFVCFGCKTNVAFLNCWETREIMNNELFIYYIKKVNTLKDFPFIRHPNLLHHIMEETEADQWHHRALSTCLTL